MIPRHPKFKDSEFACKCGCGLGIEDMQPKLLNFLYHMRDDLGVPLSITSAVRCAKHNKAVGGASDSAHLRGWALDIRTPTSARKHLILTYLYKHNVPRIGISRNFIHFDFDPSLAQDITFPY